MARVLLLVAVAVAFVRFVSLGEWSLWIDEAYTLADARHGETPLNPLGYWLFGWVYSLSDARPDELLLRLPSALIGWICIPLTAWAMRPFVGRRAAALAALFVALSPWHIYWSQNARFYTAAQAAGLVGTRLLFDGLRVDRAVPVLAGTLALGIAAAFHPTATWLLAALLVVPLLLRWTGAWPGPTLRGRGWRALLVVCLAALAVGLLWAPQVWEKWNRRQGVGDPVHLVKTVGYLVSPLLGLGVMLGAWRIVVTRARAAGVLLGIVAAGMLGAFTASFVARVSAQYVFVLLPHMAALAAFVVAEGGRPRATRGFVGRSPGRSVAFALAVLLAFGAEASLYFTVRQGDRPRWRAAYRYVFDRREPTDLVLGMEVPVGEYYWNPASDDLRDYSQIMHLDHFRSAVGADWARYGRRTWMIVNESQLADWPASARQDFYAVRDISARVVSFELPLTPRDLDVHVFLYDGR